MFFSLFLSAVDANLQLNPETVTVLRGAVAQFTCKTSNTVWTVMVWSLDDKPVLTISNHTGVLPSVDPYVTAEPICPDSLRQGWIFSLNTTEVQDQAKVTCDLLNIQRETASLFVQGRCVHAGGKQKGLGVGWEGWIVGGLNGRRSRGCVRTLWAAE